MEVAEETALKAGDLLKKYYKNVKKIDFKGDGGNVVTEADKEAEKLIVDYINKNFPEHKILAEESGYNDIKNSEYLWAIDPLDGTTNFSHGYPIYTVSIALLKNGKPIVGVVYVPHMNELYKAELGKGATLNGEKISVNMTEKLSQSLLVTGFSYDRSIVEDNNYNEYIYFSNLTHGVRRSGSAAYDLVSVASGKVDGYWEKGLNLWDVAAGLIILKESGGRATDIYGKEIADSNINIVASNPILHKDLQNDLEFIKNDINI
jgi:myo-inositol-1(or 4)-monophosphatase